ncbi:thioesterase family protein [Xanthobacter pseudotagetidis]|uniref:thioesterase family protein n=1 Tax=Xanthobacter pseudotagetidis TaxID=3119911 RepID=UPI0037275F37
MIVVGARTRRRVVVDDARAITFMGPTLRVYGTPNMLYDVEMVCRDLLLPMLDPGHDSVGAQVRLVHSGPAVMGAEVDVEAEITSVDGRRVTFEAVVRTEGAIIGTVAHQRGVVEVARLQARVDEMRSRLEAPQACAD